MRSASRYAFALQTKRSEEHTSELQSHVNIVCRLLLEKKESVDVTSALQLSAGVREAQLRSYSAYFANGWINGGPSNSPAEHFFNASAPPQTSHFSLTSAPPL